MGNEAVYYATQEVSLEDWAAQLEILQLPNVRYNVDHEMRTVFADDEKYTFRMEDLAFEFDSFDSEEKELLQYHASKIKRYYLITFAQVKTIVPLLKRMLEVHEGFVWVGVVEDNHLFTSQDIDKLGTDYLDWYILG
jgi:hypothetical protein